jgi:simple sugar transport system substrate-binding protein
MARNIARVLLALVVVSLALVGCERRAEPAAQAPEAEAKWCSGVTIRFFVGGDPGDAFASIVHKGALAAQADLGPEVEYVFSGWSVDKMVDQLREAIAAKPDGIAMMGHPGDDAIMPLAKQAHEAGILMMYQNVDLPKVRAQYGGGYVGAILEPQGRALGAEAVRQLGLKAGDEAIVIGPWGMPGRYIREEGTALALEEAGLVVHRISDVEGMGADPSLLTAPLSAAFLANPNTKLIVYPGGQTLGAAQIYMEAIGKKPGEVFNIGFDTSPAVIDAFEKGYVQLTSDQQPFLQGYLPILSLCLCEVYGLSPMFVDTGAGFVDQTNYKNVADLAIKGYR